MESALVITPTEKGFAIFAELLRAYSLYDIVHVHSCGEGRRLLLKRVFNFVIISMPLHDETGEDLARKIAENETSQVILAVNSEIYGAVSSICEKDGILTIEKPVNKEIFRQALSLARTIQGRFNKIQNENKNLKQKIDNIRIIDRAKNILISSCRMSEHEAHRHIEKMAMDTRTSKREISEKIIYDYENGPENE